MSYCRFQNTASALRDCYNNLDDSDLSSDEKYARSALIELCKQIVQGAKDLDDEEDLIIDMIDDTYFKGDK